MATRKKHTREFKLEALELARDSGKSGAQVERDLGLFAGQLSVWKRQLETDGEQAFPGNGRLKEDEAVIRRMQREIEVLRQERDILKKALAIFSQEQP